MLSTRNPASAGKKYVLDANVLMSAMISGKSIYPAMEKKTEINCNLAQGIYQLKVETDAGSVIKKIIIQ